MRNSPVTSFLSKPIQNFAVAAAMLPTASSLRANDNSAIPAIASFNIAAPSVLAVSPEQEAGADLDNISELYIQHIRQKLDTLLQQEAEASENPELRQLRELQERYNSELAQSAENLKNLEQSLNALIASYNRDVATYDQKFERLQQLERDFDAQYSRLGQAQSLAQRADDAADRVIALMNPMSELSARMDAIADDANAIIEAAENGTDSRLVEAQRLIDQYNNWLERVQGEMQNELDEYNAKVEDLNAWVADQVDDLENLERHYSDAVDEYNDQIENYNNVLANYQAAYAAYEDYYEHCENDPDDCDYDHLQNLVNNVKAWESNLNSQQRVVNQREGDVRQAEAEYKQREAAVLREKARQEQALRRDETELDGWLEERQQDIEAESRSVDARTEELQQSLEDQIQDLKNQHKEIENQIRAQYGPQYEQLFALVRKSLEEGPQITIAGTDLIAHEIENLGGIGEIGPQIVAALTERSAATMAANNILSAINAVRNAHETETRSFEALQNSLVSRQGEIERKEAELTQATRAAEQRYAEMARDLESREDEISRQMDRHDRDLTEFLRRRAQLLHDEEKYFTFLVSDTERSRLGDQIQGEFAALETLAETIFENPDQSLYSFSAFPEFAATRAAQFGNGAVDWTLLGDEAELANASEDRANAMLGAWFNILVEQGDFNAALYDLTEFAGVSPEAAFDALKAMWAEGIKENGVIMIAQSEDQVGYQYITRRGGYWIDERGRFLPLDLPEKFELFEYRFETPSSTPAGQELRQLYQNLQNQFKDNLSSLPPYRQGAVVLAEALIREADKAVQDQSRAQLISYAKMAAEIAAGLSPAGDAVDLYEAMTGYSITGTELSSEDRIFAAAGLIVGNRTLWKEVFGPLARKLGRIAGESEQVAEAIRPSLRHVPVEEALQLERRSAHWARSGGQRGAEFVRELPEIPPTRADSFIGTIHRGEYRPGEILFQARTPGSPPTRWFGPVKAPDAVDAAQRYALPQHNTAEAVYAYVVRERVSGYAGGVAGGGGFQFWIPPEAMSDADYQRWFNDMFEEVPLQQTIKPKSNGRSTVLPGMMQGGRGGR